MKLLVIKYGGEEREVECDSFEFRTNYVASWIRVKQDDSYETIHDVATIKSLS